MANGEARMQGETGQGVLMVPSGVSNVEDPQRGRAETGDELALIGRFESIVGRYSGRPAICSDAGDLTYAELNAAANRLAHLILQRRGSRGDRAVILMSPEPPLYAAMLGVLKAARIVVVLNPVDPRDRLAEIIRDADPALILADKAHRTVAEELGGGIDVATIGEERPQPPDNPAIRIAPDEIAFLVYTSGSTGRPKAVMKSHGHLLQQYLTCLRIMEVTAEDRILMPASLGGGQGINTTWVALAAGAALVPFPAATVGVTGLSHCMVDGGVTLYVSSASLFRTFMDTVGEGTQFPQVRVVALVGDAARWQDFRVFRDHFPDGRMLSAFAASETGYITALTLPRHHSTQEGLLSVGQPCEGIELRILDKDGRQCPHGVVGTIEVRGRHLASGYWRDPELTGKVFGLGPEGVRIFRSSDLAQLTVDGTLILTGRADATVKIRGHRVDLSEVERALVRLPGVESAAAGTVPAPNGEPRLVAYVVPQRGSAISARRLRTMARYMMARHLMPSSFVFVDQLPFGASGKIDRYALKNIVPSVSGRTLDPASTETERMLASIWEEAFEIEGIGRSEDFFDLGGDSLLAAAIAARVHAAVGVKLDLGIFFDTPVLKDMSAAIDRLRARESSGDEVSIIRVPRDRPLPLSFHQLSMWKQTHSRGYDGRYDLASFIVLNGDLNIECLRQALDHVVERHEPLRTRFPVANGVPVQVIDAPGPVALPFVDLSGASNPKEQATLLLQAERARAFNLVKAPPVRFGLIKLGPDCHLLSRSSHHIISDAPSWSIFMRDLGEAYEALSLGIAPSLPPLPFQYADYAAWQRQRWRQGGERYRETVCWWKEQFSQLQSWRERVWLRTLMRPRPVLNPAAHEWRLNWGMTPEAAKRLEDLACSEGATYYMVRVATLVPLLAVLTGRDSVLIGGIFTSRNRVEFERVFGLFAGGVALVLPCEWHLTFREFVGRVRARIVAVRPYAELPYGNLRDDMADEAIDLPPPHFGVHMTFQSPPMRFGGLELQYEDHNQGFRRGILFNFDRIRELEEGCAVAFDARIYDPVRMRGLAHHLVRFIEAAALRPDARISELIEVSGIVPDLPGGSRKEASAAG